MSLAREAIFGWFIALVVLLLSFLTLAAAGGELLTARDRRSTEAHLRTLSALTIRNFPERNLDSPELFWQAMGREDKPMKDEWGTTYQLSMREEAGLRIYYWTSAGPDRSFGTRDDIVVEVPYPNVPLSSPDLAPGSNEPASSGATDAK